MVFCFEKLGRMVSHSLQLATVVRGRIGGEGVRCIYLGHSHPTSTKPSKMVKKKSLVLHAFVSNHLISSRSFGRL